LSGFTLAKSSSSRARSSRAFADVDRLVGPDGLPRGPLGEAGPPREVLYARGTVGPEVLAGQPRARLLLIRVQTFGNPRRDRDIAVWGHVEAVTGERDESSFIAKAAEDRAELCTLQTGRILELACRTRLLGRVQHPFRVAFVILVRETVSFHAGEARTRPRSQAFG